MAFHEVLFPISIAYGSTGGPTRKTNIITLDSGVEQRNTPWAQSRHTYNVSYGVKTYESLWALKAFWENRSGPLYGFRFRDFSDFTSTGPQDTPTKTDQVLQGTVDGVNKIFQLVKLYTDAAGSYTRTINKPVSGSVLIADNGTLKTETTDYVIDYTKGIVTFGTAPIAGHTLTAGFKFDVPVRFQDDKITINLQDFNLGQLDPIILLELRLDASGNG